MLLSLLRIIIPPIVKFAVIPLIIFLFIFYFVFNWEIQGGINWVAVGTVATVILAIVASFSLYVNIKRKDREKPQIVERVKNVISPFINQLSTEKWLLEKGEFGWYHDGKRMERIEKLSSVYDKEIIFDNFKRKHPIIVKKIDTHNEKLLTLEKKIKDLDEAIYTSDFKEKCNQLIKKYNETCPKEHKIKNEDIGYLPGKIVEWIIENKDEEGVESRFRYFWEENKDELLKIRGEEGVKDKKEDLNIFSNQLKSVSVELRKSLEKLRRKYESKYNLTSEEMKESNRYISI